MSKPAEISSGPSRVEEGGVLSFSSIIGALSYALDLTEGAQPGHAMRSCLLGMRIGAFMGLGAEDLSSLYYALLLKDAGCSSNASRMHQIVGGDEIHAKALTKTIDHERIEWKQFHFLLKHVHSQLKPGERMKAIGSLVKNSSANAKVLIHLRCEQGAMVVRELGLGQGTADAIYNMDEHWNGLGYPERLSGEAIPLLSRILSLAQTLEVFHSQYGEAAATDVIQRRSGRWFDPEVVRAAVMLIRKGGMWDGLDDAQLRQAVIELEPRTRVMSASPEVIDSICGAFAKVVDAKSHSTYMHSAEVSRIAVELGERLNLKGWELTMLRRAGLLHDIGKLSVPNSILDKPGKLTAEEWGCIKNHPRYTFEILSRIPSFAGIAGISASHHEKLDGSGYYRGMKAEDLSQMARILTVADMYEALSANRPYRGPMTPDEVLGILRRDVPHAIDAECFAALESLVAPKTEIEERIPNLAGMLGSLAAAPQMTEAAA